MPTPLNFIYFHLLAKLNANHIEPGNVMGLNKRILNQSQTNGKKF